MVQYSNFSTNYKTSKGRVVKEQEDLNRTCFMRDRDRIIHSSAFRRLKYKTQVFVYHEQDYYRTRLSHSLEVSQLARSISKVFGLNDDLAESISLSHDLGHTPFGHAGEEVLNDKMSDHGGFNHNFQALKILTILEKKYMDFDGLNLTFETLDGILKHNGPIYQDLPDYISNFLDFFKGKKTNQGSFESQIAAKCDDIAYNNNDIDDGFHAGLFDIEELAELEIIKEIINMINSKKIKNKERFKYELIRKLINFMVDDLIKNTKNNLFKLKIKSSNDILEAKEKIVELSEGMMEKEKKLKQFLRKKMYNHPIVKTMNFKAKKIISDLFDLFSEEPYLLPMHWRNFEKKNDKLVNVLDYISGMTDKYAINIHKKYFDLYSF